MWAKLNEFRWSTPKRSIAKCHELLYVVGLDNDRKHTCITPIDMSIHKQLPKLKLEGEGACRIASSNVTFGLITNNVVRIFSGGTTTNQLWNSEPLTDDSFLNLDYVDNRLTATTTNGKLVTFNSTDRSSFVVA
ncbi:hypothetical protein M3Y94_01122200 [Aphelenchoides besseyi]|nr:hypothetical protein M3Y94_01122200 [Aphelenchoides besseyi]